MASVVYATAALDGLVELSGTACCMGVFDGVHLGHRALIDELERDALRLGCPAVVITFDKDPDELFRKDQLRKIQSNEDRIAELARLDVASVVVLPFTPDFAALSPDDFLNRVFGPNKPLSLRVGVNFRFGSRAAGTTDYLVEWGAGHGMGVHVQDLLEIDGLPVSATRIRALLQEGDLEQANSLMGRPFYLRGAVETGRGEGREMGFRTANMTFDAQHQVLADGVYAAWAHVGDGRYKAAVSMGVSPTFEQTATATCEVHILDFDRDIYGETIKIEFVHRLRAMKKFDDIDELIRTVMGDIAWVRENL